MFELYGKDFEGYQINIYAYLLDEVYDAYAIAQQNHLETIFAYCTLYSVKGTVIPIPDFKSFIDKDDYFYIESLEACKRAAENRGRILVFVGEEM